MGIAFENLEEAEESWHQSYSEYRKVQRSEPARVRNLVGRPVLRREERVFVSDAGESPGIPHDVLQLVYLSNACRSITRNAKLDNFWSDQSETSSSAVVFSCSKGLMVNHCRSINQDSPFGSSSPSILYVSMRSLLDGPPSSSKQKTVVASTLFAHY